MKFSRTEGHPNFIHQPIKLHNFFSQILIASYSQRILCEIRLYKMLELIHHTQDTLLLFAGKIQTTIEEALSGRDIPICNYIFYLALRV